jgi:hypothetical protein
MRLKTKDDKTQRLIHTSEWKPTHKEFCYPKEFVDWVEKLIKRVNDRREKGKSRPTD